jgi:hypothetical protein
MTTPQTNREATMRLMAMIRSRRIEARVQATRERHTRDYLYSATAKGRRA